MQKCLRQQGGSCCSWAVVGRCTQPPVEPPAPSLATSCRPRKVSWLWCCARLVCVRENIAGLWLQAKCADVTCGYRHARCAKKLLTALLLLERQVNFKCVSASKGCPTTCPMPRGEHVASQSLCSHLHQWVTTAVCFMQDLSYIQLQAPATKHGCPRNWLQAIGCNVAVWRQGACCSCV